MISQYPLMNMDTLFIIKRRTNCKSFWADWKLIERKRCYLWTEEGRHRLEDTTYGSLIWKYRRRYDQIQWSCNCPVLRYFTPVFHLVAGMHPVLVLLGLCIILLWTEWKSKREKERKFVLSSWLESSFASCKWVCPSRGTSLFELQSLFISLFLWFSAATNESP